MNKDLIYLEIAKSISKLSKDKNTQVGSVIVDCEGKVVSLGYNGAASSVNDENIPYGREKEKLTLTNAELITKFGLEPDFESNKYDFMLHSEQNALLSTTDRNRLKGATIYITHYPCNVCSNMIAQAGIKRIVCLNNEVGSNKDFIRSSLYIIQESGIDLEVI